MRSRARAAHEAAGDHARRPVRRCPDRPRDRLGAVRRGRADDRGVVDRGELRRCTARRWQCRWTDDGSHGLGRAAWAAGRANDRVSRTVRARGVPRHIGVDDRTVRDAGREQAAIRVDGRYVRPGLRPQPRVGWSARLRGDPGGRAGVPASFGRSDLRGQSDPRRAHAPGRARVAQHHERAGRPRRTGARRFSRAVRLQLRGRARAHARRRGPDPRAVGRPRDS